MKKAKAEVDIAALRKSLPKMPGVTEEQFETEVRKTINNLTLRLPPETAAKLVYLNLGVGIPKAAVVKDCLEDGLERRWRQISEAGIQMAAQSIDAKV